jgi:eukaryotic-like serine/threonine-protein kinase
MAARTIAGRYRLEELLGTGGMAEVWRATDLELDRTVALKLLAADADRARFAREARAVAALAHPNITQLYDYGESDERPYIVLEYLSGGTLEERLRQPRPLDDATTARVAGEMAAGLAHAHARGLVHRDLKPANVLFDEEGRAKIADFGIARLAESATLTEAGTMLGTAAYISPEQAAGESASAASDVYSFGVVLFQMLTGRLPFAAEGALTLAALHRDAEPPAIQELRPDGPAELVAVTAAALAKSPADRPADGAELLAALGTPIAATTAVTAASAPTQIMRADSPPSKRRRRAVVPILAGIGVLAVAGVAVAFGIAESGGGDAGTTPTTLPLTTISSPTNTTTTGATEATQETTGATTGATTTAPTTTAPATTRTTPTRTRPQTTTQVTTQPPVTTEPTAPPVTTEPPPTDTTPTVP